MTMLRLPVVVVLASLSAACGDEPAASSLSEEGETPGAECGLINETRACACEDAPGAQVCTAGGWSLCSCVDGPPEPGAGWGDVDDAPTPAGNLRDDITFAWERTEPSQGSCEPGNYTGTFSGFYASGLTFVNAPIPVFALGTGLTPGLEFTLEQTADGETLRIANGKMTGTADGLFPFNGTITGSLNCKTNKFDAILDGYYSLGVDGVGQFWFKGPLLANYDRNTHSMVDGAWDVTEYNPPPIMMGAGGWGTWSASWVP